MNRSARIFIVLACLFVLTMLVMPFIGRVPVTRQDVMSLFSDRRAVFWTLRVPRVCMAILAGASLSLAGATLQAVFRNPLATPYTLGVSSGAAFAVAACLAGGMSGLVWGLPILTLAAFGGAMLVVVIVYGVANARKGFSTATLLLAGVSIGFISSTGILLIEYFSKQSVTNATVKWLMGSVVVAGFDPVLECIPLVALAVGGVWYLHRDLDLIVMGDLVAAARGVNVVRSRRLAYFAASAMTGAVVAHTGPIGFVGLVVPHVMRYFVGANHRRLIPACLLAGGTFLPICDTLARQVLWWFQGSSLDIPVGILTNLIGGFFFLYILLTSKQESPIA